MLFLYQLTATIMLAISWTRATGAQIRSILPGVMEFKTWVLCSHASSLLLIRVIALLQLWLTFGGMVSAVVRCLVLYVLFVVVSVSVLCASVRGINYTACQPPAFLFRIQQVIQINYFTAIFFVIVQHSVNFPFIITRNTIR